MTLTRQRTRQAPAAETAPAGTRQRVRNRTAEATGYVDVTRVIGDPNGEAAVEVPLRTVSIRGPVPLGDCDHPAYVRVDGGITKNMGNFESIRVGVSIQWPFPPTQEALEQTTAWVSKMVDEKIGNELDLALSGDLPSSVLDARAEFGEGPER